MFSKLFKKTTITVDGLPVNVKAKSLTTNRAEAEADVIAARAKVVGDLSDLYDEFPDYDTLEAIAAHEAGL